MFKYNYIADLFDRLIKNADFPMQVELHPGAHCGGLHCRYCYGKHQKLNEGLLTIEDYSNLIDDINGKTNLIDISGIASDPLSYPYIFELIELLKEKHFNFGIHVKGNLLNRDISKLLNSGKTDGNFITLSFDSANSQMYNKLHGLSKNEKIFEFALEQLRILRQEKENNKSKLRINVGYLLFEDNSKDEDIEKFIKIFEPLVNVIRFSIPQFPNIAKPSGYIKENKIRSTLERLKKYEKENIVVLKFDYSIHDKSFNTCWAQRFNLTIDKGGNVFPCPQVALSNYNHISYGNIGYQNIWEIWNSKRRKDILKWDVDKQMKCRVCDRKDENINIELEKILNPKNNI